MNLPKSLSSLCRSVVRASRQAAGFTMIELLIVISILGILAVAVLSAIDPIEQINRGRDTGYRSDAEQLISALDRYNAFQGYHAWVSSSADTTISIDDGGGNPVLFDMTLLDNQVTADCEVANKLAAGDDTATSCPGANELKQSFINRVTDAEYRGLYIYNEGSQGDSTYVCFLPQSGAFLTEAQDRCDDTAGTPDDFPDTFACDNNGDYYVCLP